MQDFIVRPRYSAFSYERQGVMHYQLTIQLSD